MGMRKPKPEFPCKVGGKPAVNLVNYKQRGGETMEQPNYEQRGYLHEEFRLFHLRGPMEETVDWHYHTFHKIIVFLSGSASYGIEGRTYPLQPGDMVLVSRGCIHRPEAAPGAPYERMILYISPEFLRQNSTDGCELETCFSLARTQFDFVVRPGTRKKELLDILRALERACAVPDFGQALLAKGLFWQFLVQLIRGMRAHDLSYAQPGAEDEKIVAILRYLSAHLTENISIDDLAARFFISKYHMMRRFRAETGYTIHNYLITKRLLLARELIAGGMPVTQACYACGFGDYSAFSRAYRRQFGQPPSACK